MKKYEDMSMLEQLYFLKKEKFEEEVTKNNHELQKIENEIIKQEEIMAEFVKSKLNKSEDKEYYENMMNLELALGKELNFWNYKYYKLGFKDSAKLNKEVLLNNEECKDDDTFLNYSTDDFLEFLEYKKQKTLFKSESYIELQNRYKDISIKYPKALEVYEDGEEIELNKEESAAIKSLKRIDEEINVLELKLAFELGCKEALNIK